MRPDDLLVADFGRTTETGEIQSILQIRTAQTMFDSASTPGRGTIRFIDPQRLPESQVMEMGFYQWGAGIFTENLFEFWTAGVSVRSLLGEASYLAVRDYLDTNDIRLSHDGVKGLITTTGVAPGGITVVGNGPLSLQSAGGDVTLDATSAVTVAAGGAVTIDGAGSVLLAGQGSVSVESHGSDVAVRGSSGVTVDGNGPVYVKGTGAVTVEARTGDVAVIGAAGVSVDGNGGSVEIAGNLVTVAAADAVNVQATGASAVLGGTTALLQGRDSSTVKATLGTATVEGADSVVVKGGAAAVVEATTGDASVTALAARARITGRTGATVQATTGDAALAANAGKVTLTGATSATLESSGGDVSLLSPAGEVKMKAGTAAPVRVDRSGSLHVPGEIYIAGQAVSTSLSGSTMHGRHVSITPVPAQFGTIGGGSWSVDPRDVVTYAYSVTGETMTVWFLIALSSVGGAPPILTLALPESRRAATQVDALCYGSDDHVNYQVLPCLVAAGENVIRLYRPSYSGTWPATADKTSIRGTISFPIAP